MKIDPHVINFEDLQQWLISEGSKWSLYAASSTEKKKLLIQIGGPLFRVMHGDKIIYHGIDPKYAIHQYNDITSKPL